MFRSTPPNCDFRRNHIISEALESRRMYTVTTFKLNNVYHVIDDAASSDIVVKSLAASLFVYENGIQVASTPRAGVVGVYVEGNDGDDSINTDNVMTTNNVQLPVTVFGGAGNDTLLGNSKADYISGDDGNDSIFGNAGNDTLDGGLGDDIFRADPGSDTLIGGDGFDTVDMTKSGLALNVTLDGVANDIADGLMYNTLDNVMPDIEGLMGSKYNDVFYGNSSANQFFGYLGNDTIYGADGDDVLSGGGGKDVIYGDAGNDSIYNDEGGAVAAALDTVYGGDGDDTFIGFYDGVADKIYGGAGNDTVTDSDATDLLDSIEYSY